MHINKQHNTPQEGTGGATKTDEFSEKFKNSLWPLPFSENYNAIFSLQFDAEKFQNMQ